MPDSIEMMDNENVWLNTEITQNFTEEKQIKNIIRYRWLVLFSSDRILWDYYFSIDNNWNLPSRLYPIWKGLSDEDSGEITEDVISLSPIKKLIVNIISIKNLEN